MGGRERPRSPAAATVSGLEGWVKEPYTSSSRSAPQPAVPTTHRVASVATGRRDIALVWHTGVHGMENIKL